jgi:hypothetical protein
VVIADLERLASDGAELPDGLTSPQVWLYLSLRALYRCYRDGHISREQAQREKGRVIAAYESARMTMEMYRAGWKRFERIRNFQSEIEKSGCGLCRKVVRIFDGRDTG